jgi:hypothetical protein
MYTVRTIDLIVVFLYFSKPQRARFDFIPCWLSIYLFSFSACLPFSKLLIIIIIIIIRKYLLFLRNCVGFRLSLLSSSNLLIAFGRACARTRRRA